MMRTPSSFPRRALLVASVLALVGACSRQPAGDVTVAGLSTTTTAAPTSTGTADTELEVADTSSSSSSTEPPATTLAPTTAAPTTTATPPRPDLSIYANIAAMNPATADARFLVYVPHEVSGDTWVIDPTTMKVIDTYPTGAESQHVVPAWDLRTLYAVSGRGNKLTPIDPTTGKPGAPIPVENPYNLYFLPDGSEAIVVAEGNLRLDFRDPHTFELHSSLQTDCYGINHLDFSADGSYFIATCEFDGRLIKVDVATKRVVATMAIDMTPSGKRPRNGHAQPQDVRLSGDGSVFFVADLQSDGVYVLDGASLRQIGFIPTGVGAHALYPSRDGTKLYVVNRGTNIVGGPPHGQGSVSVLDFATRTIEANWPIPGGGSPDMGNLTPDGRQLWLGGRYDGEVYVFDTTTGSVVGRIKVGTNPHGLTVWPQPGRFSLGHTGNMR